MENQEISYCYCYVWLIYIAQYFILNLHKINYYIYITYHIIYDIYKQESIIINERTSHSQIKLLNYDKIKGVFEKHFEYFLLLL